MKYQWLMAAVIAAGAPGLSHAAARDRSAQAQQQRASADVQAAQADQQRADAQQRLEQAQQALEEAAQQFAALSLQAFNHSFDHDLWRMNMSMGWARLGINLGGRESTGAGLVVQAVTPGGAADRAGIRAGDTLTTIDGTRLDSKQSPDRHKLVDLLGDIQPGRKVKVGYTRDGKVRQATLTADDLFASVRRWASREGALAQRQAEIAAGEGRAAARAAARALSRRAQMLAPEGPLALAWPDRWGDMELAQLTPQLGQYFGAQSGLLVVRAPHDDALKLEDGDVILRIGKRTPHSPMQAVRILRSYAPGDTIHVDIMRDRKRQELTLTLPKDDTPADAAASIL